MQPPTGANQEQQLLLHRRSWRHPSFPFQGLLLAYFANIIFDEFEMSKSVKRLMVLTPHGRLRDPDERPDEPGCFDREWEAPRAFQESEALRRSAGRFQVARTWAERPSSCIS